MNNEILNPSLFTLYSKNWHGENKSNTPVQFQARRTQSADSAKILFIKPCAWIRRNKAYGQLVLLGYDVATFTPAAYQGRSLQPPL